MLVLSRKEGESIILQTETGESIKIQVVNIKGNQVKIGIEAARSVKISREEIIEKGKVISLLDKKAA